jgi:hypothetical protein
MEERKACALLRSRFEAAGFRIQENRPFEEAGVRFDIDGFDPQHRVGYEYVTAEAGDGWDVDADVIAALHGRMQRGELYVLVVDETKAPDEPAIDALIEAFFAELRRRQVLPVTGVPAKEPAGKGPAAGRKPAGTAAKPPPPPPPKPRPKPPATPAAAKAKSKPKR